MYSSRATSLQSFVSSSSIYSERQERETVNLGFFPPRFQHKALDKTPRSEITNHTTNPYASSLWYLTRANHGSEIKELQKRTKNHKNLYLNTSSLKAYKATSGSISKEKILPLLPERSLLKGFETPDCSDPPSAILPTLKLEKPEMLEEAAKTLLSLTELERHYIQNLELMDIVCDSFHQYIINNKLPIRNMDILILFGNFKIMITLSELFLKNMMDSSTNITSNQKKWEIMFDYFNRVFQVYPSFALSNGKRLEILSQIKSDKRFGNWLKSIDELLFLKDITTIDDLIILPLARLKIYLGFLQDLNSDSRLVTDFIKKFEELLNLEEDEDALELEPSSPCFLDDIPREWKMKNKVKWKELSKESLEYQQLFYFQSQFKSTLSDYKKLIKLIKHLLAVVTKIQFTNLNIANGFNEFSVGLPAVNDSLREDTLTPKTLFFKESFITSSYQLYLEKIEHQNSSVNELISHFEYALGSKIDTISTMIGHLESRMNLFSKSFNQIGRDEKIENLIKFFKFNKYLIQTVILIGIRTDQFLLHHLKTISNNKDQNLHEDKQTGKDPYSHIIDEYLALRAFNKNLVLNRSHEMGIKGEAFVKSLALTRVIRKLYK